MVLSFPDNSKLVWLDLFLGVPLNLILQYIQNRTNVFGPIAGTKIFGHH